MWLDGTSMSESKIEKEDDSLVGWKTERKSIPIPTPTLIFHTARELPSQKILDLSWCRAGQISLPDKEWQDYLAKITAATDVQTDLLMTHNQFNLLSEIRSAQLMEYLKQKHFTSIDISNNKLSNQQLFAFLDGLPLSVTALTCDLKFAVLNPEADITAIVAHLPNHLQQLTITGSYTSQVVDWLNDAISKKEDLDLVLLVNGQEYPELGQLDSERSVAI